MLAIEKTEWNLGLGWWWWALAAIKPGTFDLVVFKVLWRPFSVLVSKLPVIRKRLAGSTAKMDWSLGLRTSSRIYIGIFDLLVLKAILGHSVHLSWEHESIPDWNWHSEVAAEYIGFNLVVFKVIWGHSMHLFKIACCSKKAGYRAKRIEI